MRLNKSFKNIADNPLSYWRCDLNESIRNGRSQRILGAISVADAALKAADVTLLKAEIINGGLTTVELIGDVAAVQAAVEVGTEVAKELNCLIAHHVISRVDAQTEVILSDPEPKSAPEPMEQVEVIEEEIETPDLKNTQAHAKN